MDLVIDYHEKYLMDRNKTKSYLKRLVMDNKYYDKKYLLNNYGLSFEEIKDKKMLTKNLYKRI